MRWVSTSSRLQDRPTPAYAFQKRSSEGLKGAGFQKPSTEGFKRGDTQLLSPFASTSQPVLQYGTAHYFGPFYIGPDQACPQGICPGAPIGIRKVVMGAVEIHPSQRRVSCEICRKHKSRCRRLHVNDLRCARCVLLGVECTAGRQNRVGRPRRSFTSDDKGSKQPLNKPVSTVNTAYTTPAVREHYQAKSPGRSHEPSPFLDGGNQLDWSSVMSLAVTGEPVLVAPANNSLDTAPAWPTMGMDFLGQASLPWDTANDLDHMFPPPDSDPNPSFTILPSYAPDTTVTTSSPSGRTYPAVEIWAPSRQGRIVGDVPVASDGLVKLSKLNLDLHIRMAAVEMNKSILDLDSFIYLNGALHIDDTTLAEFMLKASQEFLQILTQLLSNQSTPSHLRALRTTDTTFSKVLPQSLSSYHDNRYLSPSPSSSSSPSTSNVSEPPLLAPIALTITSIFIQLISLYELTLEHLTTRIERIAMNPIRPIPRLSSGGLSVAEPCIQGMLFSEVVVHLLERIERLLGIGAVLASGDEGLLSARQRDVLWSELSGSLSALPSHGVTRPANVRNTFKKVAVILKQISIDEQNW
ncbi:hypothetical protein V491_00349 [Pseudogymnoascus sp. VKM F-3775]|nr:hypothetical protein V491_00349 [Pseudogymnoascus sp. VKM F-3775]